MQATLTLGRGAQPATARLGPELGPGSGGFTRAGHGPLHGALAAPPPSSPPCGADALRARRCWVQATDRSWRGLKKKKSVLREEHTTPAGHSLPLCFPPPNPTPGKF